jgi:hypothetical protein
MPVHRCQIGDLRFGFLDAVLREVSQPKRDDVLDAINRYRLGDSKQLNRGRVAADPTAGLRYARADGLDALS